MSSFFDDDFQFHQGLSPKAIAVSGVGGVVFQFHQGLSFNNLSNSCSTFEILSIPSRIIIIVVIMHSASASCSFNSIKDYHNLQGQIPLSQKYLSIPSRIINLTANHYASVTLNSFQFHQGLSVQPPSPTIYVNSGFQFHQGLSNTVCIYEFYAMSVSFNSIKDYDEEILYERIRGFRLSIPSRIIGMVVRWGNEWHGTIFQFHQGLSSLQLVQLHMLTTRTFNSIKDYLNIFIP